MNKIKLIPRLFFITCLSVGLYSAHAGNDIAGSCLGKNYTAAIVPEAMSVAEMKQRFRCLVEADIKAIYFDLLTQYESIREEMSEQGDSENIKRLRIQYKAESNQALLAALKPHPRSIAIAQAALESAWGTSRFFREANNIFGIRPYHQNEPKIAAKKRHGNKTIWLKKYASIKASIKDYYLVLGRGPGYQDFRNLKMNTNDPYKLVKKLHQYSERNGAYGDELSAMIRYNKFYELD